MKPEPVKPASATSADVRPLPVPSDPIIATLAGLGTSHLDLYRILYQRRDNPPTMNDIREFDRTPTSDVDSPPRNQIDRRVRDLYVYFRISKVRRPGERAPGYRLEGWETATKTSKNTRISKALRARVLSPQRCAMCGRSPMAHGVVMVLDHKLPQGWGGTNEEENLQPLCEDCNSGEKAWFSSYEKYAAEIEAATKHAEPHKRIGELLKAFNGDLVSSDLLSVVASLGAFQEGWQKRLRELRTIGWRIGHKNVHIKGGPRRIQSHYYLIDAEPWPPGAVSAAVKAAELQNAAAKLQAIAPE